MKAVICEYPWQADSVAQTTDDILVSISPEMSFELNRRGIPSRECSEICRHEQLWAAYPGFVHNVSAVTARLDQILRDTDLRFRDIGLPIFDRLGHIIKVNHDQAVYYAHMIRELMDQGSTTIACAGNGDPCIDEYGMFESDVSIIPEVVRAFGSGPDLELMAPPPVTARGSTPRFSFGQPLKMAKKIGAERLYNPLCDCQFWLRSRLRGSEGTRVVLSVGCKEVDSLDHASLKRIRVLRYNPEMEYTGEHPPWPYHKEFCARVANDGEINRLLSYRGANLTKLMMYGVSFLADKLEYILEKRKKIHAFLDKRQVDFVIFQTMAPLYLPNILIYDWCRDRHIPFACWMHGGYGAYESLQGYDVTDYRISPRHLVYGRILTSLPKNPRWILHNLGYSDNLKEMFVAGSPYYETLYKDYSRPENRKKKVLFCLGNSYGHNKFYFGHNRKESELHIWNAHKRILEVLIKFQNTFDICLKDYPGSPQQEMWRGMLGGLGAGKIAYISGERPFDKILAEADLHVFSWVSSTFFQSMYTDADICLYDNTDLTAEARELFDENLVFGSELGQFCRNLETYLLHGKFYTQDKGRIREWFIDPGNRCQREEQFEDYVIRRITD